MANEVRIDLVVKGEQQAERALKNVGDAAEKGGDGLQAMARDAGFLDRRIDDLKGSISGLVKEIDATGDLTLLKEIKADQRQLRALERLKASMTAEAEQAALEAGRVLSELVGKGLLAGKPAVMGALGLLAADTLPFLGGVVSSAVLGGVGAGGIIGGITLASQDARVVTAAQDLAKTLGPAFSSSAEPFVGPLVASLDHLAGAGQDVAKRLGDGFSQLAPVVLPLTRGLTGLADEVMPGVLKGFEAAKPVLRAVGNELPKIGAATSDFLEDISEDSDGAVIAFTALSNIIQGTIRGTGKLISSLSQTYEWSVRTAKQVTGTAAEFYSGIPLLGDFAAESFRGANANLTQALADLEKAKDPTDDWAGSLDGMGQSAGDAAAELRALDDAMNNLFGNTMSLHQATMRYEESLDELAEELTDGKRTLDATTEAGRDNRGAVLDQIDAIKGLRDANIDNNMSVTDANALYDKQLEKLRKQLLNLGYNKDQVNELIGAYKQIPLLAETEVRAPGLLAAVAAAKELNRLLGSNAAGAAARSGGSQVSGRAAGGPVYPGQTYVVGEDGPEVLQMGSSAFGNVLNTGNSRSLTSGPMAGSWTGGGTTIVLKASDPAVQAFFDMLDFRIESALDAEASATAGGPR